MTRRMALLSMIAGLKAKGSGLVAATRRRAWRRGLRPLFLSAALGSCAVLALSACTDYLAVDSQGDTTAELPKSASSAPKVKGDTCGASALQYLVGKNKAEAPAPVDPSRRRVYCSSCAVPLDYRPGRVDIEFDAASGRITAVKCG